jgi:hypothetical protein
LFFYIPIEASEANQVRDNENVFCAKHSFPKAQARICNKNTFLHSPSLTRHIRQFHIKIGQIEANRLKVETRREKKAAVYQQKSRCILTAHANQRRV